MKSKIFAAAVITGIMAAAMCITSFAGGMACPADQKQKLPEFRYTEEAPYMNAILDHIKNTQGQYYEAGDVMIPNFIIMKADESNPGDIKVWGNFEIENYDLQGDNLFCKNGGSNPGLIHLRKTPAGTYEVTGADMVGDGSNYTPDVNRIFGADQDLLRAFGNQDLIRDKNRTDTIRRYVMRNNLPINTYQDYGWDKVSVR